MGVDRLHAVLGAALAVPGADEVEARAVHAWGGLARFARSAIHQHVATDDTSISVRVVTAGRIGVVSTNDATPEGAAAAAARALAAARLSPPDERFPGLAGPTPLPTVGRRYDEATAAASPGRRAEAVAQLLARLGPGQEGAGAIATGATEVALVTTAGARLHALSSRAAASAVVMDGGATGGGANGGDATDGGPSGGGATGFGATGGGASGHGEDSAVALDALDPGDVGARAAETATAAVDPVPVDPGTYQVVLLPAAVATLLDHLASAFSAKEHAEGRSPFSGHLGEACVSPLLDLADDALGQGALGAPFDGEGTPRQRVQLLSGGAALGLVHDRTTAAVAGAESTGHGYPAPNPFGPYPGHLVLAPGASSVDELVAGIDQGLMITRFWYTRDVNPKRTLITGMTRDGTFLIDGGRRGRPVRNLRYNQSILEALASCDGVGDTLRASSDEGSDIRSPALRLRSFTFTSASDH